MNSERLQQVADGLIAMSANLNNPIPTKNLVDRFKEIEENESEIFEEILIALGQVFQDNGYDMGINRLDSNVANDWRFIAHQKTNNVRAGAANGIMVLAFKELFESKHTAFCKIYFSLREALNYANHSLVACKRGKLYPAQHNHLHYLYERAS